MIKLEIQALSQVGMVRDNNEDMVSLGGILLRDDEMSFPIELDEESQFNLLVADGMGGHEHGERASQGLLEHLNDCFKNNLFHADTLEEELCNQVKAFSDRLNQQAMEEGQSLPMGCTLTGFIWSHGKTLLVNAGDSRTYRYRDGILRRITQDDTMRDITSNPYESKALLNCIGGGAQGELMVVDFSQRLLDQDMLLICSDGLTDMLSDEDIEQILDLSPQPVDDLYKAACERGGFDNVSIVLAKITIPDAEAETMNITERR